MLLTFSIPITFPPKPHLLMLRSKLDFLHPHAAFVLCSRIAATVGPQLFCSASQSESRLLPQGLKRAAFHACDAQVPRRPFKQPAALQGGCWNRGNAAGSPHGTGANSSSPHLMLWVCSWLWKAKHIAAECKARRESFHCTSASSGSPFS